MAEEIRLGASGLWTDPSELQAPPGALREALNVRIRRPNVIEPRPGFNYAQQTNVGDEVTILQEWQGGLLVVGGTELHHVVQGGANTEITDPAGASLAITYADSCLVPTADVVLVPTNNGVFEVDEDLDGYIAGLPQSIEPIMTDGSGAGVPNADTVSVRTLITHELASGRRVFSAPSEPVTYTNGTGSAASISVRVNLPDDVLAGMHVQIYRTEVVTPPAETGDEMYLCADVTLVSGDISAGYVDVEILETTAESLGASLYTNETQEGVLEANYQPLPAKRIAWFNQMAFYADLEPRYAHRFAEQSTNGSGDAFTFGVYAEDNLTFGSGVTTISGLATGLTDSLAVGMYVSDIQNTGAAGTYFAADTTITVVNATSIDISNATLAAGTSQLTYFFRVLTIAGNTYRIGALDYPGSRQAGSWSVLAALVNADGVVRMNLSGDGLDPEAPFVEVVGDASFSLSSNEGGFGNIITVAGVSSSADTRTWPARLTWSKTLQPEAVPLLNFIDLGSHLEPILGLQATRDSLFVFKTDGAWRVTGNDPATLRVDEFDRSIELIHPRAIATYDNSVWAWTTKGIIRINEGGSQSMSDTTIRDLIEASQRNIVSQRIAGTHVGGCFIGSSETDACVVVGVPASSASATTDPAEYAYVFEARTNAWVRWRHGGADTSATLNFFGFGVEAGTMVFGGDAGGFLTATDDNYDYIVQKVITGSATNATGPDGNVYPGSCDDITSTVRGDRVGTDALILFEQTGSEDHILSAAVSDAPYLVYYAYECRVDWVALTAGNPGQLAHWRDIQFLFGDASLLPGVDVGFSTERVPTEAEIELRTFDDFERPEPVVLRGRVTRAHARAKRLRVKMSSRWAGQSWRLEGVAVTVQPQRGGERTP